MSNVSLGINEYWQLIQTHGLINFVLFLISIYFVPFVFKLIIWMIKNLLGPIFRVFFNDFVENKIKKFISDKLSKLTGQQLIANDIPHLESDYLYLYKVVMTKQDILTIEFTTIEIRVRFWRLLGRVLLNHLRFCFDKAAREDNLKLTLSKEIKEIRLQNPIITWNTKPSCTDCSNPDTDRLDKLKHKHEVANEALMELLAGLQHYELHLAIDRGSLKFNIRGTYYGVDNLGGYIHNQNNRFQLYFNGLYDGQIISFANEDQDGSRYHLVVPGCTITATLWEIITDYIPSLQCIKPLEGDAIGRLTDVHCHFAINEYLELTNLEWQIRDVRGEYNRGGKHSYRFASGEGSFHINALKSFTVSKFIFKVNNHAIGWNGKFVFDQPLNSKPNLKTNSGSFYIALDSNTFSFANSFNLSVLDRFWLNGKLSMVEGAVTLAFDSDGESAVNALAIGYKKLRLIVDRFYGDIIFGKDSISSNSIACRLTSIGVGESADIDTQSHIAINNLSFDLPTQAFTFNADASNMDIPAVYKSLEFSGRLNGNLNIAGVLSKAHSSTGKGCYNITHITFAKKHLDFLMPESISGSVTIDENSVKADAFVNGNIPVPCTLVNGKLSFQAPDIFKSIGGKITQLLK